CVRVLVVNTDSPRSPRRHHDTKRVAKKARIFGQMTSHEVRTTNCDLSFSFSAGSHNRAGHRHLRACEGPTVMDGAPPSCVRPSVRLGMGHASTKPHEHG